MPNRAARLGQILSGLLLVMIASLQTLGPSEEVARLGALAAVSTELKNTGRRPRAVIGCGS